MTKEQILEQYKEPFLAILNDHCNVSKAIGSGPAESPKWIQLQEEDEDEGILIFRNSQRSNIEFSLPINEDHKKYYIDYLELYNYFKTLKYEFIRENHPTITSGGTM